MRRIVSDGLWSIDSALMRRRMSRRLLRLFDVAPPPPAARADEDVGEDAAERGGATLRNACRGSGDWLMRAQTSDAVRSPTFGYNFITRFHDSSSCGLVMIFRYAITSLMCACSKKRTPERISYGISRRDSSICSSSDW